jgi:hypothetical protein
MSRDQESRRRFTLLDAMVLLAATGIGLAGARAYQASMDSMSNTPRVGVISITFGSAIQYFGRPAPFLAGWTVALFILRLRRPRPHYRRLVRSPGFAAGYAAILGLACCAVSIAIAWLIDYLKAKPFQLGIFYMWMRSISFAGPSVAAVWLSLALQGHWRRRGAQDWIEISGIVLGVCWLASFAATQINFLN